MIGVCSRKKALAACLRPCDGLVSFRSTPHKTARRLFSSQASNQKQSPKAITDHYNWPKEYQSLYLPNQEEWRETLPLQVTEIESGQRRYLSHVIGPKTPPLMEKTMFETLEETVSRYPDHKALSVPFQDTSFTYSELKNEVESLALGLINLGVKKGDRVGVWLPNCKEWILLQYATARIGAILVCINPAYRAFELVHSINLTSISLLIFCPALKSSNFLELLQHASPGILQQQKGNLKLEEMPSLKQLVHTHFNHHDDIPSSLSFPSKPFHELMVPLTASRLQTLDSGPSLHFDDPVNIQFTSGTTGLPKGSTLTHKNIVNNGFFVGEKLHMSENDTLVTPTPMYHCFGCVMSNIASITHGTHIVYPAPQFNAELTLEAVQRFKATILHGVPTMFISEMALPSFKSYDLSSLRTGIMAGSPCPEVTMNRVMTEMHMKEITICYGMTETSPVSAQTSSEDPILARVETVGKVHPHLEVKIIDPNDGHTVHVGEPGEILTKGYSVMKGYWGDEVATSKAIIDGWMHTGDIGTIDEQGYVRVIGRNKDMISRGGEKIYPREVEEFLYSHPDIQDVQIVGVPDERLGEKVFAWIKLKKGSNPLTQSDLSNFCKGNIAYYKIPEYVACLKVDEDFPMTISGKVQKFILRQRAENLVLNKL